MLVSLTVIKGEDESHKHEDEQELTLVIFVFKCFTTKDTENG